MKVWENEKTIDAIYMRDTSKAWLLNCEGDQIWFPKSHTRIDAKKSTVTMPNWLFEEKFPGQ